MSAMRQTSSIHGTCTYDHSPVCQYAKPSACPNTMKFEIVWRSARADTWASNDNRCGIIIVQVVRTYRFAATKGQKHSIIIAHSIQSNRDAAADLVQDIVHSAENLESGWVSVQSEWCRQDTSRSGGPFCHLGIWQSCVLSRITSIATTFWARHAIKKKTRNSFSGIMQVHPRDESKASATPRLRRTL